MSNRWKQSELKAISDIDFAITILNERLNSVGNVYSPLAQKICSAKKYLADMRDREYQSHSITNRASKLPVFVYEDYALYPCANAFNKRVSYWISKKHIGKAYYAFSVGLSTYKRDLYDQHLDAEHPDAESNKEAIQSYARYFEQVNETCTRSLLTEISTPAQWIISSMND